MQNSTQAAITQHVKDMDMIITTITIMETIITTIMTMPMLDHLQRRRLIPPCSNCPKMHFQMLMPAPMPNTT